MNKPGHSYPNRADYFELKVQGYNDLAIMKMYGICSPRVLTKLRKEWGFEGIKTQRFMLLMDMAKENQVYEGGTRSCE